MMGILLLVLLLLLLGTVPIWPHSRQWGYRPSGLVSVILIILIFMALSDRL
ncbi:DUF3309 family protein [Undibacterium curvum]|uniref:DUF3309 domain-containing protein n=1 Tax=Undibacterium curvum TaxID=2762294 RepID=A0ABR7A047_9BURK|nr:DUF3309 family protein [Undibacterium curvum]MBC3930281.1 DUF3309 domain-containing protein [Undibacterium curvum]